MSIPFKLRLITLLVSSTMASAVLAEDTIDAQPSAPAASFTAALKLAKENDPELKYAFYNFQAEQEQDDIAFSQLLPTVSLDSTYNYSNVDSYYTSDDYTPTSDDLVERTKDEQSDYLYRLSLKQSLINVAAWKAHSSAEEAVRNSQYTYTRAEQELIYRLSQAYLEALLASQQVYINQEKLESLQLKLDQTSRMNELGVGDRLNVLRATSSRDVARSDLLQAKSRLEDAQTHLENITGSPVTIPEKWIANGHRVLPKLSESAGSDWELKLQNNASVMAEMSNVHSKELEAESKTAQHLPTLSFSLSYVDRHSEDVYVERTDATASLNLTVPIYSGGRTSAQARQAEAGYNAAQARYEKTLSDKRQAIKLAYSQLSSYRERLQALAESRNSSQAFLEAAERQADLSLGSQVDVLEARSELYDVRLEFAKTLSDYLLSDLNLQLESGELSETTLQNYDALFDSKSHL